MPKDPWKQESKFVTNDALKVATLNSGNVGFDHGVLIDGDLCFDDNAGGVFFDHNFDCTGGLPVYPTGFRSLLQLISIFVFN